MTGRKARFALPTSQVGIPLVFNIWWQKCLCRCGVSWEDPFSQTRRRGSRTLFGAIPWIRTRNLPGSLEAL